MCFLLLLQRARLKAKHACFKLRSPAAAAVNYLRSDGSEEEEKNKVEHEVHIYNNNLRVLLL